MMCGVLWCVVCCVVVLCVLVVCCVCGVCGVCVVCVGCVWCVWCVCVLVVCGVCGVCVWCVWCVVCGVCGVWVCGYFGSAILAQVLVSRDFPHFNLQQAVHVFSWLADHWTAAEVSPVQRPRKFANQGQPRQQPKPSPPVAKTSGIRPFGDPSVKVTAAQERVTKLESALAALDGLI